MINNDHVVAPRPRCRDIEKCCSIDLGRIVPRLVPCFRNTKAASSKQSLNAVIQLKAKASAILPMAAGEEKTRKVSLSLSLSLSLSAMMGHG